MSSVQFEESISREFSREPEERGFIGLLLRSKIVRTREQAATSMLIFGVLVLFGSIYVFWNFGRSPKVEFTREERAKIEAHFRRIESGMRLTK